MQFRDIREIRCVQRPELRLSIDGAGRNCQIELATREGAGHRAVKAGAQQGVFRIKRDCLQQLLPCRITTRSAGDIRLRPVRLCMSTEVSSMLNR